jgi:hypothetical protein
MQVVFIIFSIFFFNAAVAQTVKETEFVGTLQLPGDVIITYKLKYVETGGGRIEGTTTTDFQGTDKTISKIIGNISSGGDKISFQETENISTKSSEDESTFCYIHLNNAKIKTIGNKTVIQGQFKGKLKNGDKCVDGYVYLIGASFLDMLAQKVADSDKFKNNDTVNKLLNTYNEMVKKDKITELKSNEVLSINWASGDVIIEVWDGSVEDGDEITIYVNGKVVLEKFGITQQKKTIVVPKQDKVTELKFVAVSEGTKPSCTVNVLIKDNNESHPLRTVLRKGESAIVKLIKK